MSVFSIVGFTSGAKARVSITNSVVGRSIGWKASTGFGYGKKPVTSVRMRTALKKYRSII